MRKRKEKKKQKKTNNKTFITLAVVLFVTILTVFLFLSPKNSKTEKPAIVFEESYKYVSDLQKKITEVEKSIFDALYRSEISERDILFSAILPKHKGRYEWEFTELIIHLPEKKPDHEIQRNINQSLGQLGPVVYYSLDKSSKNETVWNIFILGCYTHKIKLLNKPGPVPGIKRKPRVAIIIDDLGYDLKRALSFINFEPGLSLSVLPKAPYTEEIAQMVIKKERELLLHLPMEPKNYPYINPGPGTLLISMSRETLTGNLNSLFDGIEGIVGVNNHMGSLFTERADKMKIVLNELKKRNLFFIDSRTTAKSVAFDLAEEMGVLTAKRSVFIDNDLSPKAMKYQIERLISLAGHSSGVIGIAHPHRVTLEIFRQYQERFRNEIELLPVSRMVH